MISKSEFSKMIEEFKRESVGVSYMDAIVHHCETTNMELEAAAKLLTPTLKKKVKKEADKLNMMK